MVLRLSELLARVGTRRLLVDGIGREGNGDQLFGPIRHVRTRMSFFVPHRDDIGRERRDRFLDERHIGLQPARSPHPNL